MNYPQLVVVADHVSVVRVEPTLETWVVINPKKPMDSLKISEVYDGVSITDHGDSVHTNTGLYVLVDKLEQSYPTDAVRRLVHLVLRKVIVP